MCPSDPRYEVPVRISLPRAREDTTALGLGAVLVGGFDDDKVQAVLRLPPALDPTALIRVGRARRRGVE